MNVRAAMMALRRLSQSLTRDSVLRTISGKYGLMPYGGLATELLEGFSRLPIVPNHQSAKSVNVTATLFGIEPGHFLAYIFQPAAG